MRALPLFVLVAACSSKHAAIQRDPQEGPLVVVPHEDPQPYIEPHVLVLDDLCRTYEGCEEADAEGSGLRRPGYRTMCRDQTMDTDDYCCGEDGAGPIVTYPEFGLLLYRMEGPPYNRFLGHFFACVWE